MGVSMIFLLGLWVQANAQEVQNAGDDEDMNKLVEMLQDDDVMEQVADKLVNKLADRAMEQVDLSAYMDEATLAKAAKGSAPPPKKAARAPAPAPSGGGFDFGEIWGNLGGGVTPSNIKNNPTRGQRSAQLGPKGGQSVFDRIRNGKAKAEPTYYGGYGGMPKVVQPAPMRPRVNMRAPFANLNADDTETDGANVFAVLLVSFFAGVALTLGVHRLWHGPMKASPSTLQGYEPLHG